MIDLIIREFNQILRVLVIISVFLLSYIISRHYKNFFGDVDDIINEGKYDSAIKNLSQLIKLDDRITFYNMRLGYCYYMVGENTKAVIHLPSSREKKRENVFRLLFSAFASMENGDLDQAGHFLDKAFKSYWRTLLYKPPKWQIYEAKAWLQLTKGNCSQTHPFYENLGRKLLKRKIPDTNTTWHSWFFVFSRFSPSAQRRLAPI